MKKIYQIVFILSVLFFIGGGESLVFGQNEIVKMLEGKMAICGLVVNESINKTDSTHQTTSVRIRCGSVSTVNTHKPWYVIDGVPQENDSIFNKISPENIEAITVLRDVAAVAIWGSRGQNGVILITLKKEEKITAKIEEVSINVFPNPTSESVNIALSLKEKSEVEIVMYNLQTLERHEVNKEIYEAGEQKINWNIKSLKNGTYNIKIKIGNQIIDRKLVIQK